MRSNTQASPDDIDLLSIWSAIRRTLPLLLGLTIGAGVLTFGVLSTMAPRYTSEAQLAIGTKTTNPFPDGKDKPAGSDSATQRMDPAAINTQVRALLSNDLLLKVARKLELEKVPEFNPREGDLDLFSKAMRLAGLARIREGETVDETMLATIGRQLEVASPKESRAIYVRFTSADATLAATFANTLAEEYRGSLVTSVVEENRDVVLALEPQIDQLRRQLIDAEAAISRTRVEIDRTAGGLQKTPLIEQRLGELTAELSRADAQKSDAESKWRAAREALQTGNAGSLPEVQKSPLIQSLEQQRVRLERSISELSASLLPGHPRMQQLNADLAGLKRQITGEIQKFAVGLEKESRVATLRVDSISKQIGDLKGRVVSTSGEDAKLGALEATAKSRRAELDRLQKQLEDNKTVVATKTVPVEAKVVAQARASSTPTFPKKAPFSILAMAGTFLLGLAWVVTRELLTGARSNPGNAGGAHPRGPMSPSLGGEMAVARAVASRISPPAAMAAAAATVVVAGAVKANEDVAVAATATEQTLDGIATRLLERSQDQPGFRTLVAPETRQIDATAEAVALAESLSDGGRQVVLVDWNLEGAGAADAIGIPKQPGMTDLLQGDVSFEDVITLLPNSTVHYIACGNALADPALAADADRLNLVLDALDEAYDHIVLVGRHEAVRALFQCIEGRFDAGITVAEVRNRQPLVEDEAGSFLGFQVTDLDVIRFERGAGLAPAAKRPGVARKAAGSTEARI
jgi:polysaccharide biosynthesis transport protein